MTGHAVDQDLAPVGAQHPVGDVHQGGFARAILTEERVQLAGGNGEIHARERFHRPEPLDDAAQVQRGRRGHRPVGWS